MNCLLLEVDPQVYCIGETPTIATASLFCFRIVCTSASYFLKTSLASSLVMKSCSTRVLAFLKSAFFKRFALAGEIILGKLDTTWLMIEVTQASSHPIQYWRVAKKPNTCRALHLGSRRHSRQQLLKVLADFAFCHQFCQKNHLPATSPRLIAHHMHLEHQMKRWPTSSEDSKFIICTGITIAIPAGTYHRANFSKWYILVIPIDCRLNYPTYFFSFSSFIPSDVTSISLFIWCSNQVLPLIPTQNQPVHKAASMITDMSANLDRNVRYWNRWPSGVNIENGYAATFAWLSDNYTTTSTPSLTRASPNNQSSTRGTFKDYEQQPTPIFALPWCHPHLLQFCLQRLPPLPPRKIS